MIASIGIVGTVLVIMFIYAVIILIALLIALYGL